MVKECLIRIEKHFLKNKLDTLREELKSNDSSNVMQEISNITNSLNKIETKYDSIKKTN